MFEERIFELNDGTTTTVAATMERTGLSRETCYARLLRGNDPKAIFAPIRDKKQLKEYTLDDGSVWTSRTLAKHLNCSESTASTRLSVMKGESHRILKPLKNSQSLELHLNSERVLEKIKQRMYYDPHGHWKLINKYV